MRELVGRSPRPLLLTAKVCSLPCLSYCPAHVGSASDGVDKIAVRLNRVGMPFGSSRSTTSWIFDGEQAGGLTPHRQVPCEWSRQHDQDDPFGDVIRVPAER